MGSVGGGEACHVGEGGFADAGLAEDDDGGFEGLDSAVHFCGFCGFLGGKDGGQGVDIAT